MGEDTPQMLRVLKITPASLISTLLSRNEVPGVPYFMTGT